MTTDDTPHRSWTGRFGVRSVGERSRDFGRRSRETLVLSAVVGALTGVGVAGFESAVTRGLEEINRLPLWGIAIAPLVGLTVAALALRWIGPSSSPATADEYLHAFHDPDYPLPLRALVGADGRRSRHVGKRRADGTRRPIPLSGSDPRRHVTTAISTPVLGAEPQAPPRGGRGRGRRRDLQSTRDRRRVRPRSAVPERSCPPHARTRARRRRDQLPRVRRDPRHDTPDQRHRNPTVFDQGPRSRTGARPHRRARRPRLRLDAPRREAPHAHDPDLGPGLGRGSLPRRDLRPRPTRSRDRTSPPVRDTTPSAGRSTRRTASRSSPRSSYSVASPPPQPSPAAASAACSFPSSSPEPSSAASSAAPSTRSTRPSSP